jgi:predicted DNA binding CopG/RHH family protein
MESQSIEQPYRTFEYYRKDRTVALRITSDMFSRLLKKAQQEQVPYQRMIREAMEGYINGAIPVSAMAASDGACKERKSTTVTFRVSDELLNAVVNKGKEDCICSPTAIRKSIEMHLLKV